MRSRRWAACIWAYLGPARKQAAAAAPRRLRRRGHHPHAGPRDHSVQLAPDHGELARSGSHRMAARPHLRVHQGAEGPGPQGRDQRAPREDRVPRVRARHHQAPAADRPIRGVRRLEGRPPDRVPEHPVGRRRRRGSTRATTRSRSACRWTTPTPCTSGTRPTCRRRATKVPQHLLDKVVHLRRAVQGRERRLHHGQRRRPGHDGVDHARHRSPTAPRRISAPPTTASRCTAACCAARSRRSRKASTRCSPSAIRRRTCASTCRTRRDKHHNSEGARSWIMRIHAAHSPIAEDVMPDVRGAPPAPEPLRAVG